MNNGLTPNTIQEITSVLRQYPNIDEAILYGSRAMGNYRENSDIDLTLTGVNLDVKTLLKIMQALDDLLLPYTIDLSILQKIEDPDIRQHILRVGERFYTRET